METERNIVIASQSEDGWFFLTEDNGVTHDPKLAATFATTDDAADERPDDMGPSWKIRVLTISFDIS